MWFIACIPPKAISLIKEQFSLALFAFCITLKVWNSIVFIQNLLESPFYPASEKNKVSFIELKVCYFMLHILLEKMRKLKVSKRSNRRLMHCILHNFNLEITDFEGCIFKEFNFYFLLRER